jgi:two-component system, NtrC family, nitrogen regulation response regulator GlnG
MPSDKTILVIDDEESICLAFRRFFERRGWRVHVAATGKKGAELYRETRPDVVFLDVRLPDASGLDVLRTLRGEDPSARVIVITAHGSLEVVLEAVRRKAFDYLVKPLDLDKAMALAARAADGRDAAPPAGGAPGESAALTEIVGASAVMQEVYKRIALVAQSDSAVLILGPTGTGKDLVARSIHKHSARKDKPFVPINCGAIPESLVESALFGHVRGAFTGADADHTGRFESADGGTILLDEIGELPPAAQVKLLRFLDSRTLERVGATRSVQVDVRVLAATNRVLPADVRAGRFRADLYYRLAVMQIELPPLSQRREDVLPLARHFLASADAGRGIAAPAISDQAAKMLEACPWPGNVRELKNAMEHAYAVAGGRAILPADLPASVAGDGGGAEQPDRFEQIVREYLAAQRGEAADLHGKVVALAERAVIRYAMERAGSNQSEAAGLLGLHRNTLRKRLRELGMSAGD